MNKKILTAEKILDYARKLITFIDKGNAQLDQDARDEVPIIDLDILKQQYLLNVGYLMIALNKD